MQATKASVDENKLISPIPDFVFEDYFSHYEELITCDFQSFAVPCQTHEAKAIFFCFGIIF